MKTTLLFCVLLSAGSLLTGCVSPFGRATTSEPLSEMSGGDSYAEQQQDLSQLTTWTLKGKAAVSSGKEGGTANVIWQQYNQGYDLELYGLLGQGRTELISQNGEVRLFTKGQQWVSTDAQTLLGKYTGWYLPVDSLFYWVRGLPAPGAIDSLQRNSQGQIHQLQQAGWTITYSDYVQVDGLWLPQRLSLHYPGDEVKPPLNVKWLSKEWII